MKTILLALILAACSREPDPPITPIQTDSTRYLLTLRDSIVLATDIRIRFKNSTADTLYNVNCNGALQPILEKRVADRWTTFLHAATDACLSQPIVIAPGAILNETLNIRGALPGRDAGPAWLSEDISGDYRIILNSVVKHYDPSVAGFGQQVPPAERSSNSFYLEAPAMLSGSPRPK